ncbi:MAG: S8 family serine peptidase [Calditrichaeota bacterium]|nr:S8 family serine peptidase [Calditrichota bacterium]
MKRTVMALMLALTAIAASAAEMSPTLPEILESANAGDQIAVIVFLDAKLPMDDVYPEARALPMGPRRDYVVQVLKERFAQMSPNVMKYLEGFSSKEVSLLRPLWIFNGIRVTATPEIIRALASDFTEIIYVEHDPVYKETLDIGWGVFETNAPQVWSQFGASGQGVIVGHKDSGVNFASCSRFDGRIWINAGEDINHDGQIDGEDQNGVDDDGNGYVDDFYGWNFDDDNNDVSDDDSHGTRTASVICSNHNSSTCDTVSMAPGAKLMILRGYNTQGAVFESSQYAIENGVNVISASLSFKERECYQTSPDIRECPNRVAHRWASEMELAAGIIHANSTGNDGAVTNPRPMSTSAPSDCPPPAMTPYHWQQGGVSSIVGVAAYHPDGSFGTYSGVGPSAWSRQDICIYPRMPWCGVPNTPGGYPTEFEDYPYYNGNHGLLKPDITAPTLVDAVSWACTCSSISGTSGATPHVGGALAVIYSAFPGITPEEAYLRLVYGALDAGDPGPDSTWGFGKLRMQSVVSQGHDTLGSTAGQVTATQGGQPLEGVRLRVEGAQEVWTDNNGNYSIFLRPGTYTGVFEKFGYQTVSRTLNIAAGQTENGDLTMGTAQTAIVNISVQRPEVNEPVHDVEVRHPLSGQIVYTDQSGVATFASMYDGAQEFVFSENMPIFETQAQTFTLNAGGNDVSTRVGYDPDDFGPTEPDQYGYRAYDNWDWYGPEYEWVELSEGLGERLPNSADSCVERTLPFNMQFYGELANFININPNGHVEIGSPCSDNWSRWPIPMDTIPNNYISVFWQDYRPELGGGVWYYYDEANGRVIIEWDDVPEWFNTGRATFQLHIYDPEVMSDGLGNSTIDIMFADYQGRLETSCGIENGDGTIGCQYCFQLFYSPGAAPIQAGRAIRFTTDELIPANDRPQPAPAEFTLMQNYPNPFNSQTTFRFNVPHESPVSLKLYDITGRLTATLFEGVQSAGLHTVSFDAAGIATGIYFAKLETQGRIADTKKILYLK